MHLRIFERADHRDPHQRVTKPEIMAVGLTGADLVTTGAGVNPLVASKMAVQVEGATPGRTRRYLRNRLPALGT